VESGLHVRGAGDCAESGTFGDASPGGIAPGAGRGVEGGSHLRITVKLMTSIADAGEVAIRWVSGFVGRSLKVLWDALGRFTNARGPETAAGLAYYAFFSLFPLLLSVVVAGSFILESERVYLQVVEFVIEAFPVSREVIESNLRRVLELRGPVGLVGLIGLTWSASSVFTTLVRNINLAWPEAEPRNAFQERLAAFVIVGMLTVLLLLSFLSSTVLSLLAGLRVPLWEGVSVYDTTLWAIASDFLPRLATFLVFLSLYRWVPNTVVKWSAAIGGAVVAALAWEISAGTLAWYLGSGLAHYEFVYGSLGTVVTLMLWIYISGWITLLGAHLSAAIARYDHR